MFEGLNQLLAQGRWEEAIAEINALLEKDEELSDESYHFLAYNLITCYLKIGDAAKASRLLKRNREILGTDYEALKKDIKVEPKQPKASTSIEVKSKEGVIIQIGLFKSDITFKDVIGLKKTKAYMTKNIIYPMQNPDIYKSYGAELAGGAVFYGCPGVGKTLLARATAGELNGKMLVIDLADIINKFAGDSEKNVKKIFEEAKHQKPAIIFIDEIDGIGAKRGSSDNDVGQGALMHNVINTLLSQLDGIAKDRQGVYVLGATNRPWDLDGALKRSGRFSDLIYVPPPTTKDRMEMFKYNLRNAKVEKIDYWKLAYRSFGMSPADIKDVCMKAANEKASMAVVRNNAMAVKTSGAKPLHEADMKPIVTQDIIRQIKAKKSTSVIEWYSEGLREMQKLDSQEQDAYKDLKRDIRFWLTKAKGAALAQRIMSYIM